MKKMKWVSVTGAALLSIGLLTGCAESEVTKVEGSESKSEKKAGKKEAPKEQQLKIGEAVNFDGLKITLNSARIEKGGELDTPSEEQFVVVNLTAENTTDKEQVVSSIMNVELKDAEAYAYTTTILTEGIKGQFDGSIQAGGTLRGEIPFDVPKSDKYELHFSNPFTSGKAIWVIPAAELASN